MAHADATDRNLRVLIVGADRTLEDEFRNAFLGLQDSRGVIYFAETYAHALEQARGRQPTFVLVDVDRDTSEVAALARQIHEHVPNAAIAGAYRLDRFEQNHSESATIIELLRADIRDFLRRPLSGTELRAVVDRLFTRQAGATKIEQGRVSTFLSNKGGVGKSTLAVNVATALALQRPDDVLLVDMALQGGTCATMLDLQPTTSIVDAVRERDRLDGTLLRHLALKHPSGLRLLASPADALDGAEVDDEATARILHLARRTFAHVIVDTFPMIDSVVTTVVDITDVGFVVVQGTAPAVAGAARFLPVLEGLGVPPSRQRLVLNTNYKPFLGNLRPGDVADRLQRTLDFVVPYEKRVLVSMNTGSPHILHASWWQPFRRSVYEMVDDLNGAHAVDAVLGPSNGDGRTTAGAREVSL